MKASGEQPQSPPPNSCPSQRGGAILPPVEGKPADGGRGDMQDDVLGPGVRVAGTLLCAVLLLSQLCGNRPQLGLRLALAGFGGWTDPPQVLEPPPSPSPKRKPQGRGWARGETWVRSPHRTVLHFLHVSQSLGGPRSQVPPPGTRGKGCEDAADPQTGGEMRVQGRSWSLGSGPGQD